MKSQAPIVVLTLAAGAVMGYLLWDLPIRYGTISMENFTAVRRWVFALFGSEGFAYEAAVVGSAVARNVWVVVLLAGATAVVLQWVRYKKTFFYALPLWWIATYGLYWSDPAHWPIEHLNPYHYYLMRIDHEFLYTLVVYAIYLPIAALVYFPVRALQERWMRLPA